MSQIDATDAKLQTHEQICSLRYAAIEKSFESGSKRMTRIEYLLYVVIGAVLLGPGFVGTIVNKLIGA